jgi:transglutaminase-like putative cysteine protease
MSPTVMMPQTAPPVPSSTAADWLAGTAVIVIAPLLRELPLWVSVGYLAAVAWRFLHTHWRWRQPGRFLRGALAVVSLIAVYRYFGSVLGREPGVSLLVLLTGLKLLELRAVRDAVLAAMLLLLVVLGGFLFDGSLLLGLYTLFSVVTVTAALVRLQNPALAPLAVARLASILVAQAIPLMLVAYLLFPRLPDAVWGFQSSDVEARTGVPEQMEPGAISSLTLSDAVAFRTYFDDTPPSNSALYWRVRVFWDTDGATWKEGASLPARNILRSVRNPVRYRLVLEPGNNARVPALDMPFIVPIGLRERAGFVYETVHAQHERQTFDFGSYTHYRAGELDRVRRARALALPATTSVRLRGLAESWRTAARTDGDIVRAALAYFSREPFFYTLTPPRLGRDPVDQFLFETRRGFCEHYAAAFVTLMRAAGVPARVVVGYQGGVFNETGNYFIVRQTDAHAWAEVWLAATGWTRVDPTAAVAPSRIEYGIDGVRRLSSQGLPLNTVAAELIRRAFQLPWFERARFRARLTWDYLNFSWYQWVGDYSLQRQTEFLAQVGLTNWSVPVMVAILVQLVFIYAMLQLRRRHATNPLLQQYERYCRKLERIGIARDVSEGPIALARRARSARPDLSSAIDAVTRLYIALRYGPMPNSATNVRALARAVKRFRPRRR